MSANFKKAILFALATLVPTTSFACAGVIRADLRDVLKADIVFSGSLLSVNSRKLPRKNSRGLVLDFEFKADRVMVGKQPSNSTIGFQEYFLHSTPHYEIGGRYVVAIKAITQPRKVKRQSDNTMMHDGPREFLVAVSSGCMGIVKFIFEGDSDRARAVEQIFDGKGDPKVKADVLAKFIDMPGGGQY